MASKSKKTNDKEALWQAVCKTCSLNNLYVSQIAADYLYKLVTTDYFTEKYLESLVEISSSQPSVVLESLDVSGLIHHSNGDISINSNRLDDWETSFSCSRLIRTPSRFTSISARDSSRREERITENIATISANKFGEAKNKIHERVSADQVYEVSEQCRQHAECRKNCSGDPYCLSSLGFEKWSSGEMDYDWPSDDDDDNCLVKRKQDVPVGLVNLGATCYVNAFLQLWYHNLAFRNAVFEWNQLQGTDGIVEALQYIFGLLEYSHRSCVDPSPLIEMLGLDASLQQDAQEFSKLFLDLLPCQEVKAMFSGSYDYVTRCSTCKTESRTSSEFNELDLSIEGLATLADCMKSFLQVEKLTGDNQYFCSNCLSKQNATRRIELQNLPPVLNIQLLRFVFDRKTGRKKKLNTSLQFPGKLELSANGDQHKYELTAVLMHSGVTAFSGHYTAHIHKEDHWYSFNDANVIKLKGKKLNLSDEESLELSGETGSSATESKKRGNRSRNAYMLVYQKKSFIRSNKDLTPSPVPEAILERVEEENFKLSLKSHAAEMQQTEQMVRVEMKKDEIAELRDGLEPSSRPNENYHFLPLAWLTEMLDDWMDIKPIETFPLLCRHGKLNWSLYRKYKVISEKKGEFIYKTYGDAKTVVLNRRDSLCYECLKNQLKWRKYKEKVEEDHKIIQSLITSQASSEKTLQEEMVWLSKSELRSWRSQVLKPLELAAQPTEKSSDSLDSIKTVENKLFNGITETAGSANGKIATSSPTNGSAVAVSSTNDNTSTTPAKEDTDGRFNSKILCDHGHLDTMEKYRQKVPARVWHILVDYFPLGVTLGVKEKECSQCRGEQQELGAIEEKRRTMVKQERETLSDLAALRNRPAIETLPMDVVYCISMATYKQWKVFLRLPNSSAGLKAIANSTVICGHGMLCAHPSDDTSLVLLWPYEWHVLSQHFPSDQTIEVKRSQGAGSPFYTTSPEICLECSQSRLVSEQLESHNFTHANIYIRLFQKIDTTTTDDSLCQQSAEEDDLDESQPENKKVKFDQDQPEYSQMKIVRKSRRVKRVRGDKHLKISSSFTLKELKVEVLTLDGQRLEGEEKTLAELRLYPECLLVLRGAAYDESNVEQLMLQQGILEEGFRGTGLIAHRGQGGTGDKSCSFIFGQPVNF
ncbi:ubiquitin carboxyl-terminal hydrolase 48-like isoform X2 [Watersipora subatra]|uniref:ubiquitin carboxyl-terminal hydrolase 48-like isoform X2 n=1 Tax=Watersipora subatra TaxID=2589382 RepID=UPI00355BEA09